MNSVKSLNGMKDMILEYLCCSRFIFIFYLSHLKCMVDGKVQYKVNGKDTGYDELVLFECLFLVCVTRMNELLV